MIDVADYQHLRFTNEFNCADFAKLVASNNGIYYPIGSVNHLDNLSVASAISSGLSIFSKIEKPRELDLIYMREAEGRRHIGLYVEKNKIYHLPRSGSPLLQKITAEVSGSIIGFYRLKSKKDA